MSASVLIVDDSMTVRMDLVDTFRAAGFRTVPCATLGEARAALAREPIALVILDVLLPDGDGVDLLRSIRANVETRRLPVLLLSTEADVRDRVRGLQTGANDFVGKPYDSTYIVARARELLRESRPHEPDQANVLVIDDSATFRETLREALERAGYLVATAPSGEDGLRAAAVMRPTAIVVDGVMPGIDGATVVRRIRLDAALRGTPCLLLTASEDQQAELHALDAGADAFVRKEESLDVILLRLTTLLRSRHSGETHAESLLGPKRILAVDDSETYLHALAGTLRNDGYDVVLAKSGEEALDMIAVQPVDCILLDVMMPGIGGHETCRRIKASPVARDVPLIMLTGLEDRSAMIDGLGTGADDFLQKSTDIDVLRARVRAQLRRKQFEDEHRKIREDLLRSSHEAAEQRAARELAETRAALAEELERRNRELEAFSYSVSHDLRAPLRAILGFSNILVEDHSAELTAPARANLDRILGAATRMGELIDDLLELARVSRGELDIGQVNLADIARAIVAELTAREPSREIEFVIPAKLPARGDRRLLRIVLENLLGNAWKFTSRSTSPRIEIGMRDDGTYFIADNGAGFDMTHAARLFTPFQRLHGVTEFPGTGIGLATVRRVIDRHGGRVWAEGLVDKGATVSFTLGTGRS